MTMDQVAARLERLERSNRRWRAGAVAMGLGLAVVLAIGAAAPEKVPDVLKAHELQVVDADGRAMVTIGDSGRGGRVEVYAEDEFDPDHKPTPLHLIASLSTSAGNGGELMLLNRAVPTNAATRAGDAGPAKLIRREASTLLDDRP